MSISFDTDLSVRLAERLTEIETESTRTLLMALPFEKYQQSCGYLEAIRQIRDAIIPEEIEKLQRS